MLWSNLIDVLRGSLFVVAHWCGGSLGAAILLASAGVRLAVMPLTLRATRRRLVRDRAISALAPALDEIKKRHGRRLDLIAASTQALYAANGISTFDAESTLSSLVQFPPAAALYAAIRRGAGQENAGGFLWVHSLARPDHLLAAVASVVSGLMARAAITVPQGAAAPHLQATMLPTVLAAIVTYVVLSHLGAGLALYSVTNSLITGVERVIAVRTLRPADA